jgi:hypothetical protein
MGHAIHCNGAWALTLGGMLCAAFSLVLLLVAQRDSIDTEAPLSRRLLHLCGRSLPSRVVGGAVLSVVTLFAAAGVWGLVVPCAVVVWVLRMVWDAMRSPWCVRRGAEAVGAHDAVWLQVC